MFDYNVGLNAIVQVMFKAEGVLASSNSNTEDSVEETKPTHDPLGNCIGSSEVKQPGHFLPVVIYTVNHCFFLYCLFVKIIIKLLHLITSYSIKRGNLIVFLETSLHCISLTCPAENLYLKPFLKVLVFRVRK